MEKQENIIHNYEEEYFYIRDEIINAYKQRDTMLNCDTKVDKLEQIKKLRRLEIITTIHRYNMLVNYVNRNNILYELLTKEELWSLGW